ncbi:ethionine resistance protein [Coemansia sp. RSA 988]|nr:ethionine resistance protein [Coemansia sp. RSA 988]
MADVDMENTDVGTNESTPLLGVSPSDAFLEISKQDTRRPFIAVAWNELKWLASSSSLTAITAVLQMSFSFVNVMSVGHLGAKELSAMSLSMSITMCIAMAPMEGIVSAMETFCSTAYTASRDKTVVGLYFQRGLFAAYCYAAMISPVMWYSESILLYIGQDPYIAKLCGLYLRITIVGLLPWAMYGAYERYLHAQGIMRVGTIVMVFVAIFHCINNYVLVRAQVFGLGFAGAPIANIITDYTLLITTFIYMRINGSTGTWGGWDARALQNMGEYLRLAIPSIIAVCAEWMGFELMAIGTSYFGAYQLAAQAIMINACMIISRISDGVGFGTSARVGNLVGAAKPRQARVAGVVSIAISVLISALGLMFITVGDKWWISVYTADPLVINEIGKLKPVASLFLINTGVNAVLSSIMRGLGRQKICATTYMINIYFIAIPIALYLGFHRHMEAVGIWIGLCIGTILSTIVQVVYAYIWLDWNDEVRRCLIRLQKSHDQIESGQANINI